MEKKHKCDKENLKECMKLKNFELIHAFKVNDRYIIGIYKGSLSKYDILIKYRQKTEKGWSRIRTPKHIHWAKDFLNFLLKVWENVDNSLYLFSSSLYFLRM